MEDLSWLDGLQDSINDSLTKQNNKAASKPFFGNLNLENFDLNGAMSGVVGGLNGLIGVNNTGQQLQQMYEDKSAYDAQFANMRAIANQNYDTLGQVLAAPQFYMPKQTVEGVRGMTQEQRNGLIGSSALSGASGGASVGAAIGSIIPGIGTAIGGAVGGLIGGIGGFFSGKRADKQGQLKAQSEADFRNYQNDNLAYAYQMNQQAAVNRIQSRDNAEKVVRAVADGGKIERKQMGIKEFSDLVLNKRRSDSAYIPSRKKCNGGVLVRYKVK